MNRPRLLDLFCGAGGCAVGYQRAGFEVVGVDVRHQPRYPCAFMRDDALNTLPLLVAGGAVVTECGQELMLADFSVIHASPPCQRFSTGSRCRGDGGAFHPDLLTPTLDLLKKTDLPWVVENVIGAPLMPHACLLCGLMFNLKVFRHRLFESSHLIIAQSHPSHKGKLVGKDGMECIVGHGGGTSRRMRMRGETSNKRTWSEAMGGIGWMTRDEMAQAIPPAYTEYIGKQLMAALGREAAS